LKPFVTGVQDGRLQVSAPTTTLFAGASLSGCVIPMPVGGVVAGAGMELAAEAVVVGATGVLSVELAPEEGLEPLLLHATMAAAARTVTPTAATRLAIRRVTTLFGCATLFGGVGII
jgi:hypothetical protein